MLVKLSLSQSLGLIAGFFLLRVFAFRGFNSISLLLLLSVLLRSRRTRTLPVFENKRFVGWCARTLFSFFLCSRNVSLLLCENDLRLHGVFRVQRQDSVYSAYASEVAFLVKAVKFIILASVLPSSLPCLRLDIHRALLPDRQLCVLLPSRL